MMLPRQANNSKRYELKRKNSFDSKPKLTGMAAINNKIEKQKPKKAGLRPQTAINQKGTLMKAKTGIPGVKSGIPEAHKGGKQHSM